MEALTSKYLFIDGKYLDSIFAALMKELMGDETAELDLQYVVIGDSPTRTFYYNALDDQQREGESEEALRAKVDAQMQRYDAISALAGFHVRLGSVTGKTFRRRRQKAVDVQLAVDALTHAFNKNMTHAVLLAGDLDFRPVVDALIATGVITEVWYEKSSASRYLYHAADSSVAITPITAYQWASLDYRRLNKLPIQGNGRPRSSLDGMDIVAKGRMVKADVVAAKDGPGDYWVWVDNGPHGEQFTCYHKRIETIECYIKTIHAPVEWLTAKSGSGIAAPITATTRSR